jgi:GNAT superfamily N-acetyltransferase
MQRHHRPRTGKAGAGHRKGDPSPGKIGGILLDFIFELILEVFGGILESILGSERVPKCLRYVLSVLILMPILILLGIVFFKTTDLVIKIVMVFIAVLLTVAFGVYVYNLNKFGFLRLAKKAELPQILKLYRSVIGKTGCTWSISYPNEATLYEDFNTQNLYVLQKGKELVGAISIVPRNELDDLECWKVRENAREIARVVIAPQHQGKGYGKFMVKKLCYQLEERKCKAVHLLASTENYHALNLYREAGFQNIGQCERYDHAYYIYEKEL